MHSNYHLLYTANYRRHEAQKYAEEDLTEYENYGGPVDDLPSERVYITSATIDVTTFELAPMNICFANEILQLPTG